MRHKAKDQKLGRSSSHRRAVVAGLVCSLIEQRRVRTTLAKAKCARALAENMVTLGRKGTPGARRRAEAVLGLRKPVGVLFDDIVPLCGDRPGGFTRIVKIGRRHADNSEMVILEWVDSTAGVPDRKTVDSKKATTVEG